jgi:hypothetical protein
MARFFHATAVENVSSIQEKGILPKFGEVYLTDSVESACRWMGFRFAAMSKEVFAVIEVEADESKLIEGTDHSPMMVQLFGVGRSLVSEKKIPKSRIKRVHYFKTK